MDELMAKYPENFTGETLLMPDPTPEQRVKSEMLMAELQALTAPLVKWIRENYGPHTEIRITWDYVGVEQHIMGVPFPYSDK